MTDEALEMRVGVPMEKPSQPVRCDVWLRGGGADRKEHHCTLDMDLARMAMFAQALERMVYRCAALQRQAQRCYGTPTGPLWDE